MIPWEGETMYTRASLREKLAYWNSPGAAARWKKKPQPAANGCGTLVTQFRRGHKRVFGDIEPWDATYLQTEQTDRPFSTLPFPFILPSGRRRVFTTASLATPRLSLSLSLSLPLHIIVRSPFHRAIFALVLVAVSLIHNAGLPGFAL